VLLDLDDKGQQCYQVLFYLDDLLTCGRLVSAGFSCREIAIGRVTTSLSVTGGGLGKVVMELSIECCKRFFRLGNIV
jgi:ElaA protein